MQHLFRLDQNPVGKALKRIQIVELMSYKGGVMNFMSWRK